MSFDSPLDCLFSGFKLRGSFLELHPIFEGPVDEDAELIVTLRAPREGNYLKPSVNTIENQKDYLAAYLDRYQARKEIYYKILDSKKGKYSGVVRLTQLDQECDFGWESLVVSKDATPILGIDAMMAIYSLGFDFLKRNRCGPWEVDKNHSRMMKIHELLGIADTCGATGSHFLIQVKAINYHRLKGIVRSRFGLSEIRFHDEN
ncbi:hypothetical protein ACYVU7_11800 [Arenicellales bacterium IMCC56312]